MRFEIGSKSKMPNGLSTSLGIFDFEPISKRMRVLSLHPGITVDQIQQQTGFELLVEGTPPVTTMPSAEELGALREQVDSTGVLRERRRA